MNNINPNPEKSSRSYVENTVAAARDLLRDAARARRAEKGRQPLLDNKGNNGDTTVLDHSLKTLSLYVPEALKISGAANYIVTCGKHSLPQRKSVGIDSTPNGHNFSNRHLMHCSSVWLCPSCRSYILRGRTVEVGFAFKKWKESGGSVYMLTLTASHKGIDTPDLVKKMKDCYKSLRHDRAWTEAWKNCPGPVGQSIVSNWEVTFGKSGSHPHRHILLFTTKDFPEYSQRILDAWCRICRLQGLNVSSRAQNFEEIHKTADYVSKIGYELTNSAGVKEGRRGDRISYPELCRNAVSGVKWSIAQLSDYIKATKGLQALHWSKGMKDYFAVSDLSDSAIMDSVSISQRVGYIPSRDYNKASDFQRYQLLHLFDSNLHFTNWEGFRDSVRSLGFSLLDREGNLLVDNRRITSDDIEKIRRENWDEISLLNSNQEKIKSAIEKGEIL